MKTLGKNWQPVDVVWQHQVAKRQAGSGNPTRRTWTQDEKNQLLLMIAAGVDWPEIAAHLGRAISGCKSQMYKLR